jgi:hypothetical protein
MLQVDVARTPIRHGAHQIGACIGVAQALKCIARYPYAGVILRARSADFCVSRRLSLTLVFSRQDGGEIIIDSEAIGNREVCNLQAHRCGQFT